MPFFRDPNLEKDQDQAQGQDGVQISSGTVQADPAGNATSPSGGKEQKSSANFTNLDSYLNNNDSKGFGQQFGGQIQGSIDSAKTNMDNTAGQVKSQINAQGSTPDQSQISNYLDNATNLTDDQKKEYQGWTTQSYAGPQSLADNQAAWGQYWGQADKAGTEAKQAGTEAGRFSLLDQYYGRPSYNFGEKSLDNLLVQDGGGFTNQQDLANQAEGLKAQGAQQSKDISNTAAARSAAITSARDLARSSLTSAAGGLSSDLDNAVVERNGDNQEALQRAEQDYAAGTLTPAEIAQLGLSGKTIFTGALADPKGLFTSDQATRSNIVDPAMAAKAAALQSLMGDPGDFDVDTRNNLSGIASGTNTFKGYGFDQAALDAQQHSLGEYENGQLLNADQIKSKMDQLAFQDRNFDGLYARLQEARNDAGNEAIQKVYDQQIQKALDDRNAARAEYARLTPKLDYAKQMMTVGGGNITKDTNNGGLPASFSSIGNVR